MILLADRTIPSEPTPFDWSADLRAALEAEADE